MLSDQPVDELKASCERAELEVRSPGTEYRPGQWCQDRQLDIALSLPGDPEGGVRGPPDDGEGEADCDCGWEP